MTVEALPWDVREDPDPPDYNALGSPGITEILWSSANGAVLFDGPTGGSPPGTSTAVDTLKVEIFPDLTNGEGEETEDVVTVTAKNSEGATITGQLTVRIRRTVKLTVAIAAD